MEVEIRRSARRRRTLSARREGDRIVVMVPARMDPAEEARQVDALVRKVRRRLELPESAPSDDELMARALRLNERYLDGRAVPTSVRWVTNQERRWASCTSSTGEIRVSHRVATMPAYVQDAVLVHELAHLLEANHGPRFHALVERYPHHLKAEGFLAGVAWQPPAGS